MPRLHTDEHLVTLGHRLRGGQAHDELPAVPVQVILREVALEHPLPDPGSNGRESNSSRVIRTCSLRTSPPPLKPLGVMVSHATTRRIGVAARLPLGQLSSRTLSFWSLRSSASRTERSSSSSTTKWLSPPDAMIATDDGSFHSATAAAIA